MREIIRQVFNTRKLLFQRSRFNMTIFFVIALTVNSYCQNTDNNAVINNINAVYRLPSGGSGLTESYFKLTARIRMVRWETKTEFFLSISKVQSTPRNADPGYLHSYTYMGKEYGNQAVGYDPFEPITANGLLYEVTVSSGSYSWTRTINGNDNAFGPVDKATKASEINVFVKVASIGNFNGTNLIENKIRELNKPKDATSNSNSGSSNNPLNSSSSNPNNNSTSGNSNSLSGSGSTNKNQTTNSNQNKTENANSSSNNSSTQNNTPNSIPEITKVPEQIPDSYTGNPLHYNNPNISSGSTALDDFNKGYQQGQQIADAILPIAQGWVNAHNKRVDAKNAKQSAENSERYRQNELYLAYVENVNSTLDQGDNFDKYVIKNIPHLLNRPSPTWEALLGYPKYSNVFGKDLEYIIDNYKSVGGSKQLKKEINGGQFLRFPHNSKMLGKYYNVVPYHEFSFHYYFNNTIEKTHSCQFIFDENNIVIGIEIEMDNDRRPGTGIGLENYLKDIMKKTGNNYILLDGSTFLLKDKIITFDFYKMYMYDLNYFYNRVFINWPKHNKIVEDRSDDNYKYVMSGLYFEIDQDSSRFQAKHIKAAYKKNSYSLGENPSFIQFVTSEKGVVIGKVAKNSIADKAGIKSGDIISDLNGTKVTMPYMLQLIIMGSQGDLNVTYLRDGQEYKTVMKYK